jgi:hypothetical protein
MAQRRHHYERAFEHFLRTQRIPYVAVDEAKRALLPEGAVLRLEADPGDPDSRPRALKSLDFVVYGESGNLLIELKGRRSPRPSPRRDGAPGRGRLESWVGLDDIDSLDMWQRLFGPEFEAAFVFLYQCEDQPPDGLYQQVFSYGGSWYAPRAIRAADYRAHMKTRSPRWRTVDLPAGAFERLSEPFCPPGRWRAGQDAGPGVPMLEPLAVR